MKEGEEEGEEREDKGKREGRREGRREEGWKGRRRQTGNDDNA